MAYELELPEELLEAAVERVLERRAQQRRWAEIEGVADYLGMDVRRVRDLRERGMPAKRIGRRLIFDLREVDRFLEEYDG